MGLSYFVGEVQVQSSAAVKLANEYIQHAGTLKDSVNHFLNAPLSSKTYDSAKNYFMAVYPPLSNALILAGESLSEAHTEYPAKYQEIVGGGDTEEDRLLDQIQQGQDLLRSYAEVLDKLEKPNQRLEQAYMRTQACIAKLQERLDKFYDFNSQSAGIFSEAEANIANLEAAISALGKGGAWNAASGTFDISRLDMSWSKPIAVAWEKRQKEIDSKVKAYNEDLQYEYEFDPRTGEFIGAFLNGEFDGEKTKQVNEILLSKELESLKALGGGFIDQWMNNNGKDALNKLFGERQFMGHLSGNSSYATGQFWGNVASLVQGGAEFFGGGLWMFSGTVGSFAAAPFTGGSSVLALPGIVAPGAALAGHGTSVVINAFSNFGSGNNNVDYTEMGENYTADELIEKLQNEGWGKEIQEGGKKSGPATIMTDPATGTKIRIHSNPGSGTPYFRVQNEGGNYLDAHGNFPSNATRQEMRDLTHFYFE